MTDRDRSTSATPFPVYNTTPQNDPADTNGKIPNLRLQHFRGRDLDNVRAWLHMVNQQFMVYDIPEHKKVLLVAQALRGDAFTFYYYLVSSDNNVDPSWKVFQEEFTRKYDNTEARSNQLRYQLASTKYHGTHGMSEYIERFRSIEAQIHDMHFCDRVLNFIRPFPHELRTLVLNSDLSYKDMDISYQIARDWAASASVD